MSFWFTATIVLYFIHLFIPSLFRIPQIGVRSYLGSRDSLPGLSTLGARAQRASENFKETMPIFIGLAVLFLATDNQNSLAVTGAQIYFLARLIFLGLYLAAIPLMRSVAWTGAFIGLVMMMIAVI